MDPDSTTTDGSWRIVRSGNDQPDLSLGIELEFVLASLKGRSDAQHQSIHDQAMRAREIIKTILSRHMRARCRKCNEYVRFQLPLNTSIFSPQKHEDEYGLWDVVYEDLIPELRDWSIFKLDRQRYDFMPLEITSRILYTSRYLGVKDPTAGTCEEHHISYQEEISAVLRTLRHHFCTFDGGNKLHYLYSSASSSLHVHVGLAGKDFELATIKKLLCIHLAAERQIDSVHATHRIGWTPLATVSLESYPLNREDIGRGHQEDELVYNNPLSTELILATYRRMQRSAGITIHTGMPCAFPATGSSFYPETVIPDNKEVTKASMRFDIDGWITLIYRASDTYDLKCLWCNNHRRSVVNLESIPYVPKYSTASKGTRNTVEFRQHTSTLQTPAVLSWVDFVVSMVSYCSTHGWDDVAPLVDTEGPLRQPSFSFVDLCSTLGCCEETNKHFTVHLNGKFSSSLRADEKAKAEQALKAKDNFLTQLALQSIDQERRDIHRRNVDRRTQMKFLRGGKFDLFSIKP
jgi:hypothetical protein